MADELPPVGDFAFTFARFLEAMHEAGGNRTGVAVGAAGA
jgi:hypothetical protein